MRSVVLVENGRFTVGQRPDTRPASDECLIRIHAAGICSSDVPRAFGRGAYSYPLVMGHELAGTVEACGSDVAAFRTGDRVTVFPLLPCFQCDACAREAYAQCRSYSYYGSRRDGGFAERLCVKAWNLLKVPDSVSLDDAALTEPTAVIVHALGRLGLLVGLPAGELCILGSGFLGLIAVQALRTLNPALKVTVVDRNGWKLARAAEQGAATVELKTEADWNDFSISHNARFPLVLEAAGAPETFAHTLKLAAPSGRVAWMGNISGDLHLPQKDVSAVLRKELTIVGCWNSEYHGDKASDWTRTLDLMANGLKPSTLVNLEVDLDGLPDAIARLDAHKRRITDARLIKVLVRPNGL